MNVYDFDGTIYKGDSTIDFYWFCLKRKPALCRYIPLQLLAAFLFTIGKYSKEKWKEKFFSFFKGLDNIDKEVEQFWNKNESKIGAWYLKLQEKEDVVISASPEFLLEEICSRLQVSVLIATKVDKCTGRFLSKNCRGKEKIRRFYEVFPKGKIENFYSDSLSDMPMAELADKSFLVKKGIVALWKEKKEG